MDKSEHRVPGGSDTRAAVNDETLLKRLAQSSERSAIVIKLTIGLALLARSARLDRWPVTSSKAAWDWMIQQGPRTRWLRRARSVDDGDG